MDFVCIIFVVPIISGKWELSKLYLKAGRKYCQHFLFFLAFLYCPKILQGISTTLKFRKMVLESKITKQHARPAKNGSSLKRISPITNMSKKKEKKAEGWEMAQQANIFFLSSYCIFVMVSGSVQFGLSIS